MNVGKERVANNVTCGRVGAGQHLRGVRLFISAPSHPVLWSCHEEKEKEKKRKENGLYCKPDGILLLCQYISIASSLACNFHKLLRKLLWQVKKKTGRLRFLLMLIKHREAWHGRDRYALDQEKASWLLRILPALTTCHGVFLNQCILSKKKKKERKKERKKSKVCVEFTWWKKNTALYFPSFFSCISDPTAGWAPCETVMTWTLCFQVHSKFS